MDLGKIEKKGLERLDNNKISYKCWWPEFLTRPSFHLTAVCQQQTSMVIMHSTLHTIRPQTTMMIERSFIWATLYLVPQSDAGYGPTSGLGGDALTWLYSIGQVSCTILGLLLFKPLAGLNWCIIVAS
jgi:hypothetical protein